MIYEIFQILLWITAILLFISGVDDLYMDLLFWLERGKYKSMMPDFSEMFDKEEKPIAILLGAWNESSVIGRTLSYAIGNQNYSNFRIFVGVYPNDPDTIRVVQKISKKDPRIIACVNPVNGPSTKADNLNSIYAGILEYEKLYGKFEILIVHDAEDFIHPNAMKLYNFLIGYKGFHAIQIPVIPIKSKIGKVFHRTYCDAFAELHTKDMIVRQAMGTFIPFAGTGMGFHRKTFNYLEKYSFESEAAKTGMPVEELGDNSNEALKLTAEDFTFANDEDRETEVYINETNYDEDPFKSMNDDEISWGNRNVPNGIKNFTFIFFAGILVWVAFFFYNARTDSTEIESQQNAGIEKFSLSPGDLNAEEKSYHLSGLTDNNSISGIIQTENGYLDSKNNVVYLKAGDGKFIIQESSWKTEQGALKRLHNLRKSGIFDAKEIKLNTVKVSDEEYFRIYISDYSTVTQANQDIIKFKLIK
ncbi:MAG: glycosyltransferase [Ignavibacteriae bacterium]|nr:glycosyltransferase [Ignavibacteriota bacterium]